MRSADGAPTGDALGLTRPDAGAVEPRGWRWGLDLNYWMDPRTFAAAAVLPSLSTWHAKLRRPAEVTEVGPHRFRLAYAASVLPQPGTILAAKGNPNRFAPAIVITHAKDVRLEDVTVHHAAGMAVVGQRTENITLRRVRVTPSPRLRGAVSVIADASHFIYCRGELLVEDCRFERMLDDAIIVHGIYVIVEERLSPVSVGVRLSHPQQLGVDFAQAGDVMRFSERETLLDYGKRTVKSVRRVNEEYSVVEFTAAIDGFLRPESRLENATWQADLTFRRNTVRHNRARSVLVTTRGKVLIEENTFERSSGTVILMEGDACSWHESGQVADVTIRRNTFIGHSPKAPLIQISPRQPGETRLQPPYHRNIRILDNTFRVVHPLVLHANRASHLRFENNRVELLRPLEVWPKGESFYFSRERGDRDRRQHLQPAARRLDSDGARPGAAGSFEQHRPGGGPVRVFCADGSVRGWAARSARGLRGIGRPNRARSARPTGGIRHGQARTTFHSLHA